MELVKCSIEDVNEGTLEMKGSPSGESVEVGEEKHKWLASTSRMNGVARGDNVEGGMNGRLDDEIEVVKCEFGGGNEEIVEINGAASGESEEVGEEENAILVST